MKTPNKMKGKSPMTKPLVGGQKNLNAGLRASIEAASPLEAAKPDFLDLDKDGNTSEPMKGAAPKMNKKPGSAMDMKSGFKMKSGPMNMKVKGSVAKMAGVSPAKDIRNLGKAIVAGVKGFADGSRDTLTKGIKKGYNKAKKAYNSKE